MYDDMSLDKFLFVILYINFDILLNMNCNDALIHSHAYDWQIVLWAGDLLLQNVVGMPWYGQWLSLEV